jgi:hypothetical protein
MDYRRPVIAVTAALLLAFGGITAAIVDGTVAHAATTTLCDEETASVGGGTYIVQNNEYDSSDSECVTTDGNADFTVANSSIDNATDGSPGAYPSIYQGCHWGDCSSGGLTSTPIEVSDLTTGKVTTNWSTTQPGGSSDYDVAYDIWFNQTPTTDTQPNCTEMMVWLNHNGSVQPYGSEVDSNVSVGGHTYNIWEGEQSWGDTISYDMTSGTTSVSDLDVGTLAQEAVSLGYLSSSCYLIDVEAGFELWQGGAGLETNSFSVDVNGSAPTPSPTPTTPTPTPTPTRTPTPTPSPTTTTPTPTPTGSSSCRVVYTLNSSWPGGFTAQAVITNTGTTTINGWSLAFTFPGDEKITSNFNGGYSQSGENVTLTNASYNGTIAPGSSITDGFEGTWTDSVANPTSFTLNGTTCTT